MEFVAKIWMWSASPSSSGAHDIEVRLELNVRQRRATTQCASLGKREKRPVALGFAAVETHEDRLFVGGFRSLARHDRPLSVSGAAHESASVVPAAPSRPEPATLLRLLRMSTYVAQITSFVRLEPRRVLGRR